MCGFLVCYDKQVIRSKSEFVRIADKAAWRGPDFFGYSEELDGAIKISHHRLSILDLSTKSNQPLLSSCGRFTLVYNGEIYNYKALENKLKLFPKSNSDSLFLLRAYQKFGSSILSQLEGMFSFVIYDNKKNNFFAARDQLGIKPLFFSISSRGIYFGSEASLVAELIGAPYDYESFSEWEFFRRPVPGYSYFSGVYELLPGHYLDSDLSAAQKYWQLHDQELGGFDQDYFKSILVNSVRSHCLSDVPIVSMLSGGIDSALTTKLSGVERCYTVGLPNNNEFLGASRTANEIPCNLSSFVLKDDELISLWKELTKLRGEPLSVPNEGLIYFLCCNLNSEEKVILTGEGADELCFGYDRIFNWARTASYDPKEFLSRYSYGSSKSMPSLYRFWSFVDDLRLGKSNIDFIEDFFIQFHLPGLLRRMDFASMAASKEARVPFVSVDLFEYLYRRPSHLKITESESKIPIRQIARSIGLNECLNRPKIGFSASFRNAGSLKKEYDFFRNIIKQELL